MISQAEADQLMVEILNLAREVQGEREDFSITFYGFAPGYGKVSYLSLSHTHNEQRFNDPEELRSILLLLQDGRG